MRAVFNLDRRRLFLVEDEQGLEDDREHEIIGLDGMLLSFALILIVLTAVGAEKLKMPASSAAIVLGAIFGALFRAAGLTQASESASLTTDSLITFDEELFLYVLLPPIIFEAGYSISRGDFFSNLATILLFAVAGTLITTMLIGQTIYTVGGWNAFSSPSGAADALDFTSPLDSYLFGALISATDPVATLSIMSAVNADPIVFTLIFGESVLNDAVAIVLFRILEDMGKLGFANPTAYFNGVLAFFEVAMGSLLVGILVAAVSALALNRINFTHHPSFELALVLLFAYSSYSTAEACGGSGILALFTTGVLCGHYHVHSLSAEARGATGVTLKALAHLAETAVFAYMGVDLFSLSGAGVTAFSNAHAVYHQHNESAAHDGTLPAGEEAAAHTPNIVLFVSFCLAVVIAVRVVVMYPLALLANCFRGERRQLSPRAMTMLVFAGLRGAIAFALAHNVHSEHGHSIAAATTTVVLATVFILGGLTRTVIALLKLEAPPNAHSTPDSSAAGNEGESSAPPPTTHGQHDRLTDGATSSTAGVGASLPASVNRSADRDEARLAGGIYGWFERVDRLYLQPTFGNRRGARAVGGDHPPLSELEMSAARLEQHNS